MHLAVGNQWGLIGMPMAQVKTIKKEEKCLTTPPPPTAYTEAKERQREQREGRKREGWNNMRHTGSTGREIRGMWIWISRI